MEKDAYTEYLENVQSRVMGLSDEEKTILTRFRETKEGILIAKIVGPDIAGIGGVQVDQFAEATNNKNKMPTSQGLGMRPQR